MLALQFCCPALHNRHCCCMRLHLKTAIMVLVLGAESCPAVLQAA